jgi:deazaflavin-dependent oxidoreductase (nitroreductase family)
MAKPYRVNAFVRINNSIISSLLRMGISMGSFALLTVPGRKSGKPIETPIAIFVHEGKSYHIASYGIVNWMRNLRAAGGAATITRRRRTEKIHAVELLPEAASPIFRESLLSGPPV